MAKNNAINAATPFIVSKGGTGATTLTSHGLLLGNGTSAVSALSAATDGQIPIGSTGNAPTLATITAGTGITVTNASGSITIASTAGGISWNNATTDATMAVNSGYVVNGAGLVTLTIPATAAVGSVFEIVGNSSSGFVIQANTGQTINFGSVPSTTAGTLSSGNRYDAIKLVCATADTVFNVVSSQGELTTA